MAWVVASMKVDCRTVGTCHDGDSALAGESFTVLTVPRSSPPKLRTSSPEMFSTISRFPAGTAEKVIAHACWPAKLQLSQLNVLVSWYGLRSDAGTTPVGIGAL